MSESVHYLEINNSNVHSKKLKKDLIDFLNDGPVTKLLAEVKMIRQEINSSKKR